MLFNISLKSLEFVVDNNKMQKIYSDCALAFTFKASPIYVWGTFLKIHQSLLNQHFELILTW